MLETTYAFVPAIGRWAGRLIWTQGDAIAQVALRFGANDIGSTMIEENVVAAAGVRFRLSRERLIELIEGAGFEAVQRDTLYRAISC